MKKPTIFLVLTLLMLFCSVVVQAAEKPRIGVLRFTNNTHAGWWTGTSGTDMQDLLINELVSTKAFSVLERQELQSAISEQQLSESGLIDASTKIKIGKMKGAQYLVAATVSAFEEDTEGSDGGVQFYGFSFGGEKKKAYIAVDLKVISAETGEIVESRTIEATSTSGGMRVSGPSGFIPGLSGNLSKQAKTPVGKAIRSCIIEISEYLECSLVLKDGCMAKYAGKEKRRREKTKSSIDLDE